MIGKTWIYLRLSRVQFGLNLSSQTAELTLREFAPDALRGHTYIQEETGAFLPLSSHQTLRKIQCIHGPRCSSPWLFFKRNGIVCTTFYMKCRVRMLFICQLIQENTASLRDQIPETICKILFIRLRVFLLAFQQCLSWILDVDGTNTFQMARNCWIYKEYIINWKGLAKLCIFILDARYYQYFVSH